MSELLPKTHNLESEIVQKQSAPTSIQAYSQQTDWMQQTGYEPDTLMQQQSDSRWSIREGTGWSRSVLSYSDTLPSSWDMTSTQNRADMRKRLFAHLHTQIKDAKGANDVINALCSLGFAGVAERLAYLYRVAEEEGESIMIQSLQNFAIFMVSERLPEPRIGVNPDGLVQAVWKLSDYGTLVMNFLESGDIAFTILYSQQAPKIRRQKISGELPPYRVMWHIDDFVSKLTAT